MPAKTVRLAATGQTIRWQYGDHFKVKEGALLHFTADEPYSRTGRNVKALCGASVRPAEDAFAIPASHGVCKKCAAANA